MGLCSLPQMLYCRGVAPDAYWTKRKTRDEKAIKHVFGRVTDDRDGRDICPSRIGHSGMEVFHLWQGLLNAPDLWGEVSAGRLSGKVFWWSERDMNELRDRVRAIESEIDAGIYRAGEWAHLVSEIERQPRDERSALRDDVSRTSRAFHQRHVTRTIPVPLALAAELGLTAVGASLMVLATREQSNVLGVVGASAWITAFQPLVKFATGRALGVQYDYAYVFGVEPGSR